jgi:hypothetical protein
MKNYIATVIAVLISIMANAQGASNAGLMFSDLKIYVVLTVLTIILLVIFIFLFAIEKRLKQLENK